MLNFLARYVCAFLGCWEYSFQTFAALEVLGATKMNQIEVNVRDHVHGKNSVESLMHRVRYQQIALTDGATVNWDTSSGQHATVAPTAGRTFANPTNIRSGEFYSLLMQQGGTSLAHTFGSAFEWPLDTAPSTSTTSGDRDLFQFWCPDGSKMLGSHLKGYRY